jgi:hypothetical protein
MTICIFCTPLETTRLGKKKVRHESVSTSENEL